MANFYVIYLHTHTHKCTHMHTRIHKHIHIHTHTHTYTLVQCAFWCRLCMINSTEILLPAVILYGKNERNQTVMCIAFSSLAIFQFLNILSTNVFIAFIHLLGPTSRPLPPALTHSCRIIRCVCCICVIPFGACLKFTYIKCS